MASLTASIVYLLMSVISADFLTFFVQTLILGGMYLLY